MRIHNQPASPTAPAAQESAQPQWQAGSRYRAFVTAVRAGQVEILIGNRYLSASTVLPLAQGQSLLLELQTLSAEGLTFRLLPAPGSTVGAKSDNGAVLIRAAGLQPSARLEAAIALLSRHGIPASEPALRQTSLLLDSLGPQRAAAFMPELRAYLSRGLELPDALLLQIAYTATAASHAEALSPYPQQRDRRGQRDRRRPRTAATPLNLDQAGASPSDLRSGITSLLGSPEHALLTALLEYAGGPARHVQAELRGPQPDTDSGRHGGEQGVADWAEAQRLRAGVDPEVIRFTLPLSLDGEPAALAWEQHELGGDYYERELLLRLKLLNAAQGRVDIMVHSRGSGLRVDVASESPAVAAAYEQELPQLVAELREMGLSVSSATATRQVLPE